MPKKPKTPHDPIAAIESYSKKKGVTILLDSGNQDHLLDQMGSPYSYDNKDKILTISYSFLASKNQVLLKEIIRKKFEDGDGILIIKDRTENARRDYEDYKENNSDGDEVVRFFKEKIPNNDLEALRMSLVIRFLHDKNKRVDRYKKNIKDRYGWRGENIANLCSAGYFDVFKKIYEENGESTFNAYYKLLVEKKAFALFVNMHMSTIEVRDEINGMIEKALNYHIDSFWVHAKGHKNVKTLTDFFSSIKKDSTNYNFEKSSSYSQDTVEYKITPKRVNLVKKGR